MKLTQIVLLSALILPVAGEASAQSVSAGSIAGQSQQTLDYWTPERIRTAVPLDTAIIAAVG